MGKKHSRRHRRSPSPVGDLADGMRNLGIPRPSPLGPSPPSSFVENYMNNARPPPEPTAWCPPSPDIISAVSTQPPARPPVYIVPPRVPTPPPAVMSPLPSRRHSHSRTRHRTDNLPGSPSRQYQTAPPRPQEPPRRPHIIRSSKPPNSSRYHQKSGRKEPRYSHNKQVAPEKTFPRSSSRRPVFPDRIAESRQREQDTRLKKRFSFSKDRDGEIDHRGRPETWESYTRYTNESVGAASGAAEWVYVRPRAFSRSRSRRPITPDHTVERRERDVERMERDARRIDRDLKEMCEIERARDKIGRERDRGRARDREGGRSRTRQSHGGYEYERESSRPASPRVYTYDNTHEYYEIREHKRRSRSRHKERSRSTYR